MAAWEGKKKGTKKKRKKWLALRGPSDKMFLANAFVIMVFFSTTAQFSHHLAGREPEGEAERAAVFKKKNQQRKHPHSQGRAAAPHILHRRLLAGESQDKGLARPFRRTAAAGVPLGHRGTDQTTTPNRSSKLCKSLHARRFRGQAHRHGFQAPGRGHPTPSAATRLAVASLAYHCASVGRYV